MSEIKNPEKELLDNYHKWSNRLREAKRELKLLKQWLPAHIENIEKSPKELAWLKKCLEQRKEMLKKEEETSGYIIQTKNKILESVRQKIEENPEETKDVNIVLVEKYLNRLYDLENIKKEIYFLETEIRVELKGQEHSKAISSNYSQKIEELEEVIEELEPKVKHLRDFLEEESKVLKTKRNTKLIKLFEKMK